MSKQKTKKQLTELEGAALAIIMRNEPCTAYVVKEAFRTSPSEFWSGSAGAVYPLINRLAARKLISFKADKADGRSRRECVLTAAGRAAMKVWLLDAQSAAGLGFDPLRTRLYFSEMMSVSEKKTFVETTLAKMTAMQEAPSDLSHAVRLHKLWTQYRIKALKAFAKD